MSYWVRKNNKHVYIYQYRDGKPVALPRSETRHLDAHPDYSIDAYVKELDGHKPVRILPGSLKTLLDKFLRYLTKLGKDRNTVLIYQDALINRVFEYFTQAGHPDLITWPQISIKMLDWLEAQGYSHTQITRANLALTRFWTFLVEEGDIDTPLVPAVRRPIRRHKNTPLRHLITPDQVLEFVKICPYEDIKIISLVGYFMSLRPQETLALSARDFRAGKQVDDLECVKAMKQYGLYGGVVVFVENQLDNRDTLKETKTKGSKAPVACFNTGAGDLLFDLLNGLEDGEFVKWGQGWMFRRWRKYGMKNVTMKDLRRASLYWLGHTACLSHVHLMKHARHASFETTLLYLRDPAKDKPVWLGKLVR